MVPPLQVSLDTPRETERRAARRVLVYSHDTFGLGNIRRMLEIARHLVASDPQMSVLIVSGSPMLHAFRIPPRIDYLKLPCLARNASGHYAPKFLDLTPDEGIRLRANLIKSAVLDFKPDLILVDKKPFGVQDELSGALVALQGQASRPRMLLLLRDILDTPEATTPVWRRNGYFEAIESYYDEVLVVGTPGVYDLREEYRFPSLAAAKVRYCGYIAKAEPLRARAAVRAELGIDGTRPLVLVTPGGGEDGASLLRHYLAAQRLLQPASRPHSLIVCGPEMAAAEHEAVAAAARELGLITVRSFSDEMMSLMHAADLVVCMGGYNTVTELLTLKRRAIVVPRVRPVQEQWIRAERLDKKGLLRAIHPDTCTARVMADALAAELAPGRETHRAVADHAIDLRGLERVNQAVQRQLHGRHDIESDRQPTIRFVGTQGRAWSLS